MHREKKVLVVFFSLYKDRVVVLIYYLSLFDFETFIIHHRI